MSTELHSTDSRDRAPVATAEADGAPPTGRAPSWRLVAVMALLIPTFVIAIAAMFVSLAVDPEPHQAPLGLVAPPPAAQAIETALADRAGDDVAVGDARVLLDLSATSPAAIRSRMSCPVAP